MQMRCVQMFDDRVRDESDECVTTGQRDARQGRQWKRC